MKIYLLPFYVVAEYFLIIHNHFRFFFEPKPPREWLIGSKGDIIIIQGLRCRWISFALISRKLNKLGYRIHIINDLGNNTKPVSFGCNVVSNYIKKIIYKM